MKVIWLWVVAAALLSLSPPDSGRLQDAEGVIARHVAALGGPEVLSGIRTMRYIRVVQNTESGETRTQSRTTFFTQRPYLYRTERSGAGSLYLSDGTKAWSGTRANDGDSIQWEETTHVLALRDLDFDRPFGPFIDFKAKGHDAVFLGETEMDGIVLEAVRVVWSDGSEWEFYFDSSTGLWYGYDASPGAPGGLIRVADYRRVGDVLIPHRNIATDTLPDGSIRVHERLYSEFQLNPSFPEGFFRPGPSQAPAEPSAATEATAW